MKLKDFKKDETGKSLALFSKKKFEFNTSLIKELKNYYKKNNKEIRICMHSSKKSNLQVMVNLIILKKIYQVHYHKYSSEYYFPLDGKIRLVTFNDKNKLNLIYLFFLFYIIWIFLYALFLCRNDSCRNNKYS